ILKNCQQKNILPMNNFSSYKNAFLCFYQLFSIKIFFLSSLYLKLYEKLYKNTSVCGIFHSATCFSCQKWYTNSAMGSVVFPFLPRFLCGFPPGIPWETTEKMARFSPATGQ
ncbi:hypothetical protein, partial [Anaerotignum lactatifermentans]|uniref:hypothetical protein n=1 Tax=Anaerotignum lactatifermentans TaxID=160404 RepID=UPI00195F5F1B